MRCDKSQFPVMKKWIIKFYSNSSYHLIPRIMDWEQLAILGGEIYLFIFFVSFMSSYYKRLKSIKLSQENMTILSSLVGRAVNYLHTLH